MNKIRLTRKLSHSLRSLGRAKSGAPLIKDVILKRSTL